MDSGDGKCPVDTWPDCQSPSSNEVSIDQSSHVAGFGVFRHVQAVATGESLAYKGQISGTRKTPNAK